jgi:hypothetical protein
LCDALNVKDDVCVCKIVGTWQFHAAETDCCQLHAPAITHEVKV